MSWPEKNVSIDQVPAGPLCLQYLSCPEQLSSKTKIEGMTARDLNEVIFFEKKYIYYIIVSYIFINIYN